MSELNPIYSSKLVCPVCEKEFTIGKVRSKAIRSDGQDTDFCPMYKDVNPLLYDAVVCPHCGFAHIGTRFDGLLESEKRAIREKVTSKWTTRSFDGTRTVEQAMEAYKLVLLNMQARSAPASELAKVCMRLAWMNRIRGDSVTEYKFLQFAYRYYRDAYSKESLETGKLDPYTAMYMAGELGRRLGHYEDSLTWFNLLITTGTNPEEKDKLPPKLLEMARDQSFQTKEDMKKEKTGQAKGGIS